MIVSVPQTHNVSELNNNLNKGVWMVWFYADWCGHCKNMEHEWSKLEQNCSKNNNINLARVRDDSINQVSNKTEVNGFPTISLYNNGQPVEQYSGDRTNEALMDYINNILKSYQPSKNTSRKPSKRKSSKRNSLKKKPSKRNSSKRKSSKRRMVGGRYKKK